MVLLTFLFIRSARNLRFLALFPLVFKTSTDSLTHPTGIRCNFGCASVLLMYPRSNLVAVRSSGAAALSIMGVLPPLPPSGGGRPITEPQ